MLTVHQFSSYFGFMNLLGHRGQHVILVKCQAKPYCLCQRGSLSPCQPFVLAYIILQGTYQVRTK